MKSLTLVCLIFCAMVSPTVAMEAHIEDIRGTIPAMRALDLDHALERFQRNTGINVIARFLWQSPTEEEDAVPGAYMKALSTKLGVIENGVLIVHFSDNDEWRLWVGNELAPRFARQSGTAAELTASGVMHEAKEAWFAEVEGEGAAAWAYWQKIARIAPTPSDRVGFMAEAMTQGVMTRLAPEQFSTPGHDLLKAVEAGDAEAVRGQLIYQPYLEVRNADGRTPLMLATRANEIAMAEMLIKAGADVNARDALEDTPYLYAGAEGRTEILKLTLAHGADLASVNRFKGTALIPAAEKGHLENVRVLLGTGIDINHVNRPGWTALYEAVMRPRHGSETYRDIVRALLEAGVDVTIPDKQGRTPEQRAREVGNDDLADLIAASSK